MTGSGRKNYYRDSDADGYGDANEMYSSCVAIANYVDVAGDCNDNDSTQYAGAYCEDDGQCEGTLDNACVCVINAG